LSVLHRSGFHLKRDVKKSLYEIIWKSKEAPMQLFVLDDISNLKTNVKHTNVIDSAEGAGLALKLAGFTSSKSFLAKSPQNFTKKHFQFRFKTPQVKKFLHEFLCDGSKVL
jgi:hypothetical protein